MLYEINNATLSVGGNEILTNFNFRIVDNSKIGLVGKNGAGKTTLLRFIMGEIELDYNSDNSIGRVIKSNDFKIGYLSQISFENKNITVFDELSKSFDYILDIKKQIDVLNDKLIKNYNEEDAIKLNDLFNELKNSNGLYYEKEIKMGFMKFGFKIEDLNKKLNEFSGGQITKISLLKLLLTKPNLLILDEPTNHLDIDAVLWIEEYLKKYKKNILVVSHDRMFLDNVCNIIYEIENKKLTKYIGGYTDYLKQKELNLKIKIAEYNNNKKELDRLYKLADRFRYKATKAKMVKSKNKIINKIEKNIEIPYIQKNKKINVALNQNIESGKVVLRCEDLVIGYKENILSKVNLVVNRTDRIGIVGKNGTGKTTFLKTIIDDIKKISGVFYFGHNVFYEYFDQNIASINSDDTVFDNFSKTYPTYTNEQIRDCLGRFLFSNDDVFKKVSSLSGGEKVKLSFAKIFEKKPNLLILDEPTNHLDILSKENLEELLNNYNGTIIFVSHDRYFTKKISNKILLFEDNKTLFFQNGYEDYEYYEEQKKYDDSNMSNYELITSSIYINKNDDKNKIDYSEIEPYDKYMSLSEAESIKDLYDLKEEKSAKDTYLDNKEKSKINKKIEKIQIDIKKYEKEILILKNELENKEIQSNFNKLYEIQEKIDSFNENIEELIQEWDELDKILSTKN